jgi:hypothetical protein
MESLIIELFLLYETQIRRSLVEYINNGVNLEGENSQLMLSKKSNRRIAEQKCIPIPHLLIKCTPCQLKKLLAQSMWD